MAELSNFRDGSNVSFSGSDYIWVDAPASGRNQFISFEQDVAKPANGALWLHLFADTRYRLFVNEQFVAYGPARFVTQHPEYDRFDLAPYCDQSVNRVRVEVNYYGSSSYQSMPDSKPGFIAAGKGVDYDFCTPGQWRARVHKAWDADAALFSFAQNAAEICDTRVLSEELSSSTVTPTIVQEKPWGILESRSAPYPSYANMLPVRVVKSGHLMADWRMVGFQSIDQDFEKTEGKGENVRRFCTWLYSETEQELDLQCFWSDLELNGKPLTVDVESVLGNHGVTPIALNAGWNLLSGCLEVLIMQWSYLLAVPYESGVTFHARPDREESLVFALSPVTNPPGSVLPAISATEWQLPDGWTYEDGSLSSLTPSRVMGWDRFDESATVEDVVYSEFDTIDSGHGCAICWTLDFDDEFYGHPVIEVDAPAGTIMDVAYDDWLSDRGMVNLYVSNPFTDTADRFVLKGGPQRIEVCNPRGGIYLQVTLRSPNPEVPVDLKLCSVAIRSRRTLSADQSSFRSDDTIMNWAFEKSLHTLVASTDEGYADCPWRERGSYIGDGYVNLHLNRMLGADLSVGRHCLRGFAQAQNPDGQLPPVAPAWLTRPHEDFTLIWILSLRDYWAMTGDLKTVRELWPTVLRIWGSSVWEEHSSGLWNSTESMSPFVDWGMLPEERLGEANATLNLFRYAALRASAELARQIGAIESASIYTDDAELVRSSLVSTLWDSVKGGFRPSLDGRTAGVHANILALRFGVGDAEELIQYLEPYLRNNFSKGIELGQDTGYAELYFFHYMLPALADAGRVDLAEALIREHYGYLKTLGYPTLNECFSRAHRGSGSCCHSWSGAPAIYLMDYVVGLRQKTAGNPRHWILNPVVSSLTKVCFRMPVEGGVIDVRLQRDGDSWLAIVDAPLTVTVESGADGLTIVNEVPDCCSV